MGTLAGLSRRHPHDCGSAAGRRVPIVAQVCSVINVLFILNEAPVEPGRSLNGLRLASSMSMRSTTYIRVFLLGPAATCARKPHGLREHEDSAALLASVIRHGGEVRICERCGDEQAECIGDLIEGVSLASLAELSRWVAEADRLLVF
jgi:sulfur relay (sulfurtransferase) complex TusBCD TusD component (DsrE family)